MHRVPILLLALFSLIGSATALKADQVITTVAGGGCPYIAPGGAARLPLYLPTVQVDPSGSGLIYVTDQHIQYGLGYYGFRSVYRVSPSGSVTVVVGPGFCEEANAELLLPAFWLVPDGQGNLWGDLNDQLVVRTPDGTVRTVVGKTPWALPPAKPFGADVKGNVYLRSNDRVIRLALDESWEYLPGVLPWTIASLFTSPDGVIYGDDFDAIHRLNADGTITSIANHPRTARRFAADAAGNLYAGENVVRRVSPDGKITVVAGTGLAGSTGDSGPASQATLNDASSVAVDFQNNLYISEYDRVRKVTPDGIIHTVVGGQAVVPDGVPGPKSILSTPWDIARDPFGNLFIADAGDGRVRKLSPDGVISTVAGCGRDPGCGRSDGLATSQQISPTDVAADSKGNIYVNSNGILRVTPEGHVDASPFSTVQGTMCLAVGPDDALYAGETYPTGQISPKWDPYFASVIERLLPDRTRVAGSEQLSAYCCDGGPALQAWLDGPRGITFDAGGNLYLADGSARVRRIDTHGIISTVAGNGFGGSSGDGGLALAAQISPFDVAMAKDGTLFIAEGTHARVRMVLPSGIISTLAGGHYMGTAPGGAFADGMPATAAFLQPQAIEVNQQGELYIADLNFSRIRKIVNVPDRAPHFVRLGITNGASFLPGLAPGGIATLFGEHLADDLNGIVQATSFPLPTSLANLTVTLDGVTAPLLAVANVDGHQQVNFVVPWFEEKRGTVTVVVKNAQGASAPIEMLLFPAQPGIFRVGAGGAVVHALDYSLVTASHPAHPGEVLALFATGLGRVNGANPIDQPVPVNQPAPTCVNTAFLNLNDAQIPAAWCGLAPGFSGLNQINFQIPANAKVGAGTLSVSVDARASNTVAIWVQP